MIVNLGELNYSDVKLAADARSLTAQYNGLITTEIIGHSHDNRDIHMVKLGYGKKHIICTAGVHGRESTNPIVLMYLIEYYAKLYRNYPLVKEYLTKHLNNAGRDMKSDYEHMIFSECVYELLNTFTILFIPLLNPDGYMMALHGFDIIKDDFLRSKCQSLQIPSEEWKFNARGIDINRNFPSLLWKANDTNDFPASENETKALINVFHKFTSQGFLDFHSRGKSIYYYRNVMSEDYNVLQLQIARRLKKVTGYGLYMPEEEINANDSGGNTVHYYSERFRKPAITIETVNEDETFPLKDELRFLVFEEIKLVIFEFGSMVI
ncbi:MAG: hypothetical protein K0S47_830 [Herbinix sp.]|jgi:g-D-glutamyl-meso-diaminopimelate peptidase|nr:hypothetical protein [Herbinix sp.]